MQNLARFAGIQDASRQMQPSPHQTTQPNLPQTDDIESQTPRSLNQRASRASLPLDRRPSRKSLYSNRSNTSLAAQNEDVPPVPGLPRYTASRSSHSSQGEGEGEEGGEEADAGANEAELPWGPSHPCFPHPNPHVPLRSPLYASTRIIRVQRDWLVAGDLYPAFQNMYPEILGEWVSEMEFRDLIDRINGMLEETFSPSSFRAVLDTTLGVLTGFLWDDAGFTGSKAGVKKLEAWMEDWGRRKEREGKEVRLISLRRTGFLSLDIQIPDPGIDVPAEVEQEPVTPGEE